MLLNYVKVSACSPKTKVADVQYNQEQIKNSIQKAIKENIKILVFPELCLSGYSIGDLIFSDTLLDSAKNSLKELAIYSKGKDILFFVGLPFKKDGLIYNVCAGICNGKILGLVPKTNILNYNEFFESRYFSSYDDKIDYVNLDQDESDGQLIAFSKNIIFSHDKNDSLKICCEIGNELNSIIPPSISHAINGARIIVNSMANPEFSGEMNDRLENIKNHSKKICAGYIIANAGEGESTTDCVFSGHNIIAENGEILAQNQPFSQDFVSAEIDLSAIDYKRSINFNQDKIKQDNKYLDVKFSLSLNNEKFDRKYNKTPFIKQGEEQFLIDIAANGLKKRIEHVGAKTIVIGISGGLDSTLALIIASRAMELLNRDKKDIIAITMPCFGTSQRTFDNSIVLSKAFNVSLKKIDIAKAVKRHLKDIGHPENVHDASYENSQARERTQVLMDYANFVNGLVIGTGDLSELALGFATYNGDHMSMYAVNGSIPKTLVRHLVNYVADKGRGKFKSVLKDILDTPVSPELIPSDNNLIKQVTEDIVGPYILHDFFLYHMIKCGFTPTKIYYAAINSFKDEFDEHTILKWLKTFVRRFFSQQFKRSCLPDGIKVTEISLSPRAGWKMPSDAISKLWLEELENINA